MTNERTTRAKPFKNTSEPWELIFFVARNNAIMQQIHNHLVRMCEKYLKGQYHIEVVNIQENPEQASAFDIIATPTLVRRHPKPERRVVGDLSQTSKVLSGLGFSLIENQC